MKYDLAAVLAEIREGNAPSFVLLYGDDYQVGTACKSILDLLVPPTVVHYLGSNVVTDEIRGAVADEIDSLGVSIAYGSLAPGADIPACVEERLGLR